MSVLMEAFFEDSRRGRSASFAGHGAVRANERPARQPVQITASMFRDEEGILRPGVLKST